MLLFLLKLIFLYLNLYLNLKRKAHYLVLDYFRLHQLNYLQYLNAVWATAGLTMTSTLIRKVYANDIRREHNGKLTEEDKACKKLDHSKKVHDTNYVLFFD